MSKEIIVRMFRGEDKTYSFSNDRQGNVIPFDNYTIAVEVYFYKNSEVYALGTDPGYGPDISPQFTVSLVNGVQTGKILFGYHDFTGVREKELYWKVIGTDKTSNLRTMLLDGYVQLRD